MRGHATPRSRIVERKHGIGRAARLERADLLKIFTFEKQRRAARRIEPRARQHRRTIDMRTNPLMRGADAIEFEKHNRRSCHDSAVAQLAWARCFPIHRGKCLYSGMIGLK